MLKENRKMKASLKEEKMRIANLTNIAYKRDPRIIEEKKITKRKRRQRAIIKQKQKEGRIKNTRF